MSERQNLADGDRRERAITKKNASKSRIYLVKSSGLNDAPGVSASRFSGWIPWVLGAAGLGIVGFVIWKRSSIVSVLKDFTSRIVGDGQEAEFAASLSPEARPYASLILQVAREKGIDPFLIAAIGQRESGWGRYLKPIGPSGTGDFSPRTWTATPMPPDGLGWGRGLMQLDYNVYKDAFANGLDWRDPLQNIRAGADNLLAAQKTLSKLVRIQGIADGQGSVSIVGGAATRRGVAPGQYPDPRPLVGDALARATLAAYNTGAANVLMSMAAGLNPDATTTGSNYASNAVSTALNWAASFNPASTA